MLAEIVHSLHRCLEHDASTPTVAMAKRSHHCLDSPLPGVTRGFDVCEIPSDTLRRVCAAASLPVHGTNQYLYEDWRLRVSPYGDMRKSRA